LDAEAGIADGHFARCAAQGTGAGEHAQTTEDRQGGAELEHDRAGADEERGHQAEESAGHEQQAAEPPPE
jgi:hypothetical protein